jgi:flagellin FlaB
MLLKVKKLAYIHNDQEGMTGLETAIILIAFVTVAAVFGYAILGAGLFSAERGKETIYAGLKEAESNLELAGSVMAMSTDNTTVGQIIFSLRNAIAGQPVDVTPCDGTLIPSNKCVISLATAGTYINSVKWTRQDMGANDRDNLLETGEQCQVTINLADLGVGKTMSDNLTVNSRFDIQVKPEMGSTITIQRQLPGQIDRVMDLQ